MPKIMFRPNPVPPPFVPPVPIDSPLTFTAREADSSVAFNIEGSVPGVSLSYSIDNGQTWNSYTFGQSINLAAMGDSVMFKGDNIRFSIDDENFIQVEMTGMLACTGSLAYLLNSNGEIKPLPEYCFYHLFYNCNSLVQAPALPAISLSDYSYEFMFFGCRSLVQAPDLPATSLGSYCYSNMFSGCSSLVEAPVLPATSLEAGCYSRMFSGCSSLVEAPVLPATSLEEGCYSRMFSGCSSLVEAPVLPATSLEEGCYSNMFSGCSSLVEAPVLPATSLKAGCYSFMFSGCSSLVEAPVLPAISLVQSCYSYMFSGCGSLNYIECYATDISSSNCLYYWVENVSASGTFKKNPSMNDWPSGANGIPNGWTIEDI